MKTLIKLFVALTITILLNGCGAVLVRADTALGGHLQDFVYGSNKLLNYRGGGDAQKTPKESFLNLCLMDESHTSEWCLKRSEEAFSPNTANGKIGENTPSTTVPGKNNFLKRVDRKPCSSSEKKNRGCRTKTAINASVSGNRGG